MNSFLKILVLSLLASSVSFAQKSSQSSAPGTPKMAQGGPVIVGDPLPTEKFRWKKKMGLDFRANDYVYSPYAQPVQTVIKVADFNNNGLPELIYTTKSGSAYYTLFVEINLNQNTQTLEHFIQDFVLSDVGDIDNDGKLDIFGSLNGMDAIATVLEQPSIGTFPTLSDDIYYNLSSLTSGIPISGFYSQNQSGTGPGEIIWRHHLNPSQTKMKLTRFLGDNDSFEVTELVSPFSEFSSMGRISDLDGDSNFEFLKMSGNTGYLSFLQLSGGGDLMTYDPGYPGLGMLSNVEIAIGLRGIDSKDIVAYAQGSLGHVTVIKPLGVDHYGLAVEFDVPQADQRLGNEATQFFQTRAFSAKTRAFKNGSANQKNDLVVNTAKHLYVYSLDSNYVPSLNNAFDSIQGSIDSLGGPMAVTDLDQDGYPEIIFNTIDGKLSIYENH